MAGSSRRSNNEAEAHHREIINHWMRTNVETKGFERFDDLHIDRIDAVWKNRDRWVDGGLEALRIARELKNQQHLDLCVALGCSLRTEAGIMFPAIKTRAELRCQLDWSPPSLYLFPAGKEPWVASGAHVLKLDHPTVEESPGLSSQPKPNLLTWYYLEFTQEARRHRSVFIVP